MSTPRPAARTARRRTVRHRTALLGAATLLGGLALTGCGSATVAGGAATGAPGTTATSPTSTTPDPSTSTGTPTSTSTGTSTGTVTPPSGDATDPVAPPVRSGTASVVGVVRSGVEPRCLLVGPYVLSGTESLPAAQQALLTQGQRVAVTGTVDPGMASYCQQGTLLAVTSVKALRPMTPGAGTTPTTYSTP